MCLITLCCCFALIAIVTLGPRLNYAGQHKIDEAMELAPVVSIRWVRGARGSDFVLPPDFRRGCRVIGDEIGNASFGGISFAVVERARYSFANISGTEFSTFSPYGGQGRLNSPLIYRAQCRIILLEEDGSLGESPLQIGETNLVELR